VKEPTLQVEHFRLVMRPLRQMYGAVPAADFNYGHLKTFREAMIRPRVDPDSRKPLQGWSRKHANRQIGRVKQIFPWAVTQGLASVTVYQTLLLLPGLRAGHTDAREMKPVRPVDESRALALVPHVPATVGAMIKCSSTAGCARARFVPCGPSTSTSRRPHGSTARGITRPSTKA
jgi:hypothetical protein